MALSYLVQAYGKDIPSIRSLGKIEKKRVRAVLEMIERGIESPPSSSCGRLFDAVSFLCGTAPIEMEYEAQAAMRLEAAASVRTRASYSYAFLDETRPFRISFVPTVREIVEDKKRLTPACLMASKFHNTLAHVILAAAERAKRDYGIETVSLAGGCFLNKRLLTGTERLLGRNGFTVLRTDAYSPNDESLSLGQIAFALARLRHRDK
jgi:hydrogenase maturation protein HypF